MEEGLEVEGGEGRPGKSIGGVGAAGGAGAEVRRNAKENEG